MTAACSPRTSTLVIHSRYYLEIINAPADIVIASTLALDSRLSFPGQGKRKKANQFRIEQTSESIAIHCSESMWTAVGLWSRVSSALKRAGYEVTVVDRRPCNPFGQLSEAIKCHLLSPAIADVLEILRSRSVARPLVNSKANVLELIRAVTRVVRTGLIFVQNTNFNHPGYLELHDLQRSVQEPVMNWRTSISHKFSRVILGSPDLRSYYGCSESISVLIILNAQDDLRRVFSLQHLGVKRQYHGSYPSQACLALDWHQRRHPEDEWQLEALYGPQIHPIPQYAYVQVVMVQAISHNAVKCKSCGFKQNAYWKNVQRNQLITTLARHASTTCPEVNQIDAGLATRYVIIVESEQHARVLQANLPGWSLRSLRNDEGSSHKAIVTLPFLVEHLVTAQVWIRASGGNDPIEQLIVKHWREDERGNAGQTIQLIDLFDLDGGLAEESSNIRQRNYQQLGWNVQLVTSPVQQDECQVGGT